MNKGIYNKIIMHSRRRLDIKNSSRKLKRDLLCCHFHLVERECLPRNTSGSNYGVDPLRCQAFPYILYYTEILLILPN